MSNFQIRLRRRGIRGDELLEDIRRVAAEHGSTTVTRAQYDEYGQFGATTVLRNYGTWNKALLASGLERGNRQDISNEELFENLAEVWTHLGRQPFGRHMSDNSSGSKFSRGTYEKRFGSWNNALIAFVASLEGVEFDKPTADSRSVPRESGHRERRTRKDINWRMRTKVLIRDSCICNMCGASPAKDETVLLHVDHIVPWTRGGETVEENLQTLCSVCNIGKSDMLI